jgi:hypothetical protein
MTSGTLTPLSTRDIQRYFHEERGLTYSTCNTIVHGLQFFYGTTPGVESIYCRLTARGAFAAVAVALEGKADRTLAI